MKAALLTALAAVFTGCVTIPGSCVDTGGYRASCYSTRYATNCWGGPRQSCKHRWLWEPDPEKERMRRVYRELFHKELEED